MQNGWLQPSGTTPPPPYYTCGHVANATFVPANNNAAFLFHTLRLDVFLAQCAEKRFLLILSKEVRLVIDALSAWAASRENHYCVMSFNPKLNCVWHLKCVLLIMKPRKPRPELPLNVLARANTNSNHYHLELHYYYSLITIIGAIIITIKRKECGSFQSQLLFSIHCFISSNAIHAELED